MFKFLSLLLILTTRSVYAQTFEYVRSVSFKQDAGTTIWSSPAECYGKMIVQVSDQSTRFKKNYMIRASMGFSKLTCEPIRWSTATNVRSFSIN
jgi:hypothetical protein